MKIVLAHYKYYIQGGPERYMLKFMELARLNGCEVIPFSINLPQNFNTKYSKYFVSTKSGGTFAESKHTLAYAVDMAKKEFHNREAYKKMKELIMAEKPDVLYTLIPGELTSDIFKAAKEANIPIILRISDFRLICGNRVLLRDGELCKECIKGDYSGVSKYKCVRNSYSMSLLRQLALNYIRRKGLYDCVDAIITPPENTRNIFIESGYFPPEKIHVNPTFIDCSEICVYEGHKNYVLCLGRFSPEKGFIYVLKAMQYLKNIPVSIAVTGTREECNSEIMQVIEDLDIVDKVNFVGFVHGKELEQLIAGAMCVACPAIWYENLPNVIIEAFAYGRPVIASNVGSLADVVDDGINGLLFERKDEKSIASCIRSIYEDYSIWENMSKHAREKCEYEFSPEAHWKRFISIIKSIGVSNI